MRHCLRRQIFLWLPKKYLIKKGSQRASPSGLPKSRQEQILAFGHLRESQTQRGMIGRGQAAMRPIGPAAPVDSPNRAQPPRDDPPLAGGRGARLKMLIRWLQFFSVYASLPSFRKTQHLAKAALLLPLRETKSAFLCWPGGDCVSIFFFFDRRK